MEALMRRLAVFLGVCCLCLGLAGRASAGGEVIEYLGPHPMASSLGRGMCFIEGPHIHAYAPEKPVLYVQAGPSWVFVGDPTEFDTVTPKYAYYGHHPVFWVDAPEGVAFEPYCYITGPHYHWFAPPPALAFKLKGGAYWFVGKHPAWYKGRVHRHLDEYYVGVHLAHPVITVAPPVGFVGVVIGAPTINVGFGFPGFGVVVDGPGYYGPGYRGHGRGHYRHGPPGYAKGWGKGHWK
jgi:hypothetical protein